MKFIALGKYTPAALGGFVQAVMMSICSIGDGRKGWR